MITRQNSKWYVFWAWQIGAVVLLGLFYLYMVFLRPFFYIPRYVYSLVFWGGHRNLTTATTLSLINAYSDRVSHGALTAFVAEQHEHGRYSFAIRPGYHPAKSVIVLSCGYDQMSISTSRG